jgi:DNA-binding transcriptional regulator YdaS (Cro superfamily)
MDLSKYAVTKGGTATSSCPVLAQIATDAGCSPQTLYLIARGHKKAGPVLARRIESATRGEVSRELLRPDYFGSSQREAAQ